MKQVLKRTAPVVAFVVSSLFIAACAQTGQMASTPPTLAGQKPMALHVLPAQPPDGGCPPGEAWDAVSSQCLTIIATVGATPQPQDPCITTPTSCLGDTGGGGGSCLVSCGGDSGGGPIACVGTTTQCKNIPCNGSQYSIDSIFTDPSGHSAQVTDINTISEYGNGITYQVGWLYQALVQSVVPNGQGGY